MTDSANTSARLPRPLRDILQDRACVTAASVFDPLSARIADRLGAEVGVMGGSVAALAVLGAPDLILLTMSELVEQARRVCRAASVRLIVDADHGYGNALNVMRTVQELAAAGVAGVTIEDTQLPRAFGVGEAPRLGSLEEGVGRMKAAVAARGDRDIVVFGRTSAASITGVDDAIARLRAYQAAGVDALFVPQLKTREDLEKICAAIDLPLVLGGVSEAIADPAWLAGLGVRVRLWGHQPLTAAVQALHTAMKAVVDGAPPGALQGLAPPSLMADLTRAAQYDAWSREFL